MKPEVTIKIIGEVGSRKTLIADLIEKTLKSHFPKQPIHNLGDMNPEMFRATAEVKGEIWIHTITKH